MARPRLPDGDGSDGSISLDQVLELLSNAERREIVRYLRDSEGNVQELDDLVAHLVECERTRSRDVPGTDHVLSVLVHVHGPKLAELGLADYDVRSGEIRYYPQEEVELMLEAIDEVAEEL